MPTPTAIADLPRYDTMRAADVEPAITAAIAAHRAGLAALLALDGPGFATLVEPLEELNHALSRAWAPAEHLNSVLEQEGLREAYNACRMALADYNAEVGQNEALYRKLETVRERESATLGAEQKRLLDHLLRDFRLAGVALPPDRKARFRQLMQDLAREQSRFDENVLDATGAWSRQVSDEAELAGLPPLVVARAAATARDKGLQGWLFLLDQPNYSAVLAHADSAALRREFYEAWTTRASDRGPFGGRFDNGEVMERILAIRHETAGLLGFGSFAELSLATKMASSPDEVLSFIRELATSYVPAARREFAELEAFAGRALAAWDVGYYAEKLREQRHSVSQEALRPWFPLPRVLDGLFTLAQRLYGICITARPDVPTWHEDAHYYAIADEAGRELGGFYIDLHSRPGKRGGAWMGECIGRKRLGDSAAAPVAHLVCNFTPPVDGQPALLTHSDVVTLFHEFGHGLHHLLTRVDYPSLAGINGVPWDAVELPSQFMEQFAWLPEVLPLVSAHVETGEPLPTEMLARLMGSRSFHAGLVAARQLEFALFDFLLHTSYAPGRVGQAAEALAAARAEVAVVQPPEFNRFAHSFMHVFSGGYAAGYYSYKWAEVLSADAFSL
nr:M3 family metallopeptidase [Steroidobacteraceae bacterium]